MDEYQYHPKISYKNRIDLDNTAWALHFDAKLLADYLEKVGVQRGINVVDSEFRDVTTDEQGFITDIHLENDMSLKCDFVFDCSGFNRVLIGKHFKQKWISYSEHLPMKCAIPFWLESEEEIEPSTTSTAMKNGWMWKIPTADRYGCGYVFDSRFITNEQAQEEIESALGHKITPIRFLKFETGRLEKLWHKNCLAVGLSAAFAEPLEATSIHSTIVQLNRFIFNYLKDTPEDTINTGAQAIYNRRMGKMYDDFKEFLVLHYQTKRTDSEFWRWIGTGATCTELVKNIIELSKTKLLQAEDFDSYFGYAGHPLWNWVLIGLGYIGKQTADRELQFYSADKSDLEFRWELYVDSIAKNSSNMLPNSYFVK
jgi:tryptophan halogenase